MTGHYNPDEPGRTAQVARDSARGWVADLVIAKANGDLEAERLMLAPFTPEAREVVRLMAWIAARADPRLLTAATGRPVRRKQAARKRAA